MITRFARSVPELCIINTYILNWIYDNFRQKLNDFNQAWLSPIKLEEYAAAIHDKGATIDFRWGFVDGTVRPICRPSQNQRIVYNGHKRVHALKFQNVVALNGLIANLYGPMEGRRHDRAFLNESGLLQSLVQFNIHIILLGKIYAFMGILRIPLDHNSLIHLKEHMLLMIKRNLIKR